MRIFSVKSVCITSLSKVTGCTQDDWSSSPDNTFWNPTLNGVFTMPLGPRGIIFDG